MSARGSCGGRFLRGGGAGERFSGIHGMGGREEGVIGGES